MRTKISILDAVGFVIAAAIGLASLAYPFGRDHGELAYVGLEWLRGVPVYRDLWARYPPGAYLLHGVAAALGGTIGIRIAEVMSIFLIGVASVGAVVKPDQRSGLRGPASVLAAVLAFGFFDFWDSGRSDLVVSALIAAAAWAARTSSPRAWWASGVLLGFTLTIAPWSAPLGVTVFVFARGDKKRMLLGTLVPLTLLGGVILARGDLGAMIRRASRGDCLREAVPTATEIARYGGDLYWHWFPITGLLLILGVGALLIAPKYRAIRVRPLALPAAMLVAASMSIWLDGSRYAATRLLFVAPAVMFAAAVLSMWTAPRLRARLLILANVLFAFWLSAGFLPWLHQSTLTLRALLRLELAEDLERSFDREDRDFDHRGQLELGRWLAAHSSPHDRVVVRGFEPQIYTLVGRRAGIRYFGTPALTSPRCIVDRPVRESDDLADLRRTRPRFVVALEKAVFGPDSPATFEALGYERRTTIEGFVVLESRDDSH